MSTISCIPKLPPFTCCDTPSYGPTTVGLECESCWAKAPAWAVNLTPHPIVIAVDGHLMTIAPSGQVARVMQRPARDLGVMHVGPEAGLPVPIIASPEFGAVEGLPAPVQGTIYIVSGLVLAHVRDRLDVYAPATGPADGVIRDEGGRIVAVTRLVAAGGGK